MHQDGQYWPIRPLATCTVWLAIDDSDRENGCLTVIPGSHREPGALPPRDPRPTTTSCSTRRWTTRAPSSARLPIRRARERPALHARHLPHPRLRASNTSGRRRAGPRAPVHADHVVVPARPRDAVRGLPVKLRGPADLARAGARRLRQERLHHRAHRPGHGADRGIRITFDAGEVLRFRGGMEPMHHRSRVRALRRTSSASIA